MQQSAEQIFFRYPHQGISVQGGPCISKLYTIHFFSGEMDYAVPGEIHPFWELIYIDFGSIDIFGDTWQLTLSEGNLMLIAPNRPHGFRTQAGQAYNMFIMSFDCAWEKMDTFSGRQTFSATSTAKQLIGHIVRQARRNFLYPLDRISANQMRLKKTADPDCLQGIRRLAELLLLNIGKRSGEERFIPSESEQLHAHPSVVKAVQYLRQHMDGPTTMQALCSHVGASPSHLQKLFRRDIGITIMQYHRFLRIAKAKYMIRQQTHTMSEIAEMSGFSSVHHFSTCFKQVEHLSPTQYAATVKKWMDGESGE